MVKETFSRNKPPSTPPPPPPDGFINLDITTTAGVLNEVTLTFSGQPTSNYYAMVYMTSPLSTGAMRPPKSKFRLIASQQVPGTPFELDIRDNYSNRFGVPEPGGKVFAKVILIDTDTGATYNAGMQNVRIAEV